MIGFANKKLEYVAEQINWSSDNQLEANVWAMNTDTVLIYLSVFFGLGLRHRKNIVNAPFFICKTL